MKDQKKVYRKSQYFEKLNYLFSKYNRILLVDTSNVSSKQIQKCRKDLNEHSVMVIGKNTLIRKALRYQIKKNQTLENLLFFITGNTGLIFSQVDPFKIQEILKSNKIPTSAKPGQISQCDVVIQAGPTDVPPEGTSFFQALNIQTKIQKGQIEIQNPVTLLTKGQIVGSSEALLLQKLNILPFSKELIIKQIFDSNSCYGLSILNMKTEDILFIIKQNIYDLNLISQTINYPQIEYLKKSIKKTVINLFCLLKEINFEFKIQRTVDNVNLHQKNFKNEIEIENTTSFLNDNRSSVEKEDSEDLGLNLFD